MEGRARGRRWIVAAVGVGTVVVAVYLSHEWLSSRKRKRRRLSGEASGDKEKMKSSKLVTPYVRRGAGPRFNNPFYKELQAIPKEERIFRLTERGMERKLETVHQLQHKCSSCWLLKTYCICTTAVTPLSLPVDFLVLMHFKEYMRGSNTGHLLPLAHNGSRILISGLDDDELKALHDEDEENVVILYPSTDAMDLPTLLERRGGNAVQEPNGCSKRTDGGACGSGCRGRLKVVLLDGTWKQARTLNRRLPPHWRRIKLQVRETATKFRLRTRTREDGICTIEAALLLLEELGCGPKVADVLFTMLEAVNAAVLSATGKPGKIAGKKITFEELAQMRAEQSGLLDEVGEGAEIVKKRAEP